MPNIHLKRFQGQNVDLIVESKSKFDKFIYFHFTNMTLKENKNLMIEYSLEEMAMILCVLRKEIFIWKSYRDEDLEVIFVWEDKKAQILWIHAGNYSKTLHLGQIEVLKLLMMHILNEKVIFATSKHNINRDKLSKIPSNRDRYLEFALIETINSIEGKVINQTDKAVLINFKDKIEAWIPKSTIHSRFSTKISTSQSFMIENWVLKKNNLDHLISDDCYLK
jgi:hypothetical protein